MKRAAALALICAIPQMAQADICADVLAISPETTTLALLGDHTENDATCRQSMAIGGAIQVHCHWRFDYRDPAAERGFRDSLAKLAACFGQETRDQDVNHPDFYDLQTFQTEGADIGLSLKDKGALGETYIFLRVSRK